MRLTGIHVEFIEHEKQRYATVGDWWVDEDGVLQVRVDNDGDQDIAFAIAIHEQLEGYLCEKRGIKEEDVTKFDVEFEKDHPDGWEEPGDQVSAPYNEEHLYSSVIEKDVLREIRRK